MSRTAPAQAAAGSATVRLCPPECRGRRSGWHAWRTRAETGGEIADCPLGAPFCSPWHAAEVRSAPFERSLPPARRLPRPRPAVPAPAADVPVAAAAD